MKSPTETPAAVDCSRLRARLADLKSSLRNTVANMVLAGKEAKDIQKRLGFTHGDANRFSPRRQVVVLGESQPTWDDWCKAELGISSATVGRYIKCFEAVKRRAAREQHSEILRLLETPSEKLKCDELAALAARVGHLVCDETESSLISEYRELDKPKKKTKADQEKEDGDKVQRAADLIFGGIDESFKKFKADVRSAFKESIGEAIQERLPLRPKEGEPLSLVQIRDDIKAKVRDVETDLKALVLSMDRQIEKLLRDEAEQSKQLTKSKR
jgi:hypothetical protein